MFEFSHNLDPKSPRSEVKPDTWGKKKIGYFALLLIKKSERMEFIVILLLVLSAKQKKVITTTDADNVTMLYFITAF